MAKFYSAIDANEIERELAELGVAFRTRIVRSRKYGVYYLMELLEDSYGPDT